MELDKRKQKILSVVIDEFVKTGEPVGSKTIAALLDNSVSSATIRNDMAALERLGLLEQPHTSSGRCRQALVTGCILMSLWNRSRCQRWKSC